MYIFNCARFQLFYSNHIFFRSRESLRDLGFSLQYIKDSAFKSNIDPKRSPSFNSTILQHFVLSLFLYFFMFLLYFGFVNYSFLIFLIVLYPLITLQIKIISIFSIWGNERSDFEAN